jgi:hypothetical protein
MNKMIDINWPGPWSKKGFEYDLTDEKLDHNYILGCTFLALGYVDMREQPPVDFLEGLIISLNAIGDIVKRDKAKAKAEGEAFLKTLHAESMDDVTLPNVAEEKPKPEKLEFKECDVCRAKPGSPLLCDGCLQNRETIGRLNDQLKEKKCLE